MATAAALWIPCPSLRFQERIQGTKNAPIARFQGLGCYQTRSEFRPDARLAALACGFWLWLWLWLWLFAFNGSAPARVASCFHGPDDKAPEPALTRCDALGLAPGAPFSGANPRPQKRPHRTVSGAWVLSKRERIQARCAAFGIRLWVLACGFQRQRAGLRCGLLARLEGRPQSPFTTAAALWVLRLSLIF